jgi:predicted house-cleaning NTP pyrophosphatase (Maf/HAM1 superfamily)
MAMQFVLGSRSPRRRELLESFVGNERLLVRPPVNSDEEAKTLVKQVTTLLAQVTTCFTHCLWTMLLIQVL